MKTSKKTPNGSTMNQKIIGRIRRKISLCKIYILGSLCISLQIECYPVREI